DILPFAFTNLAETIQTYVKQLQSLRDRRSEQIVERNRQIEDGLYQLTSDPRDPVTAPQRQQPAPQLNFAPLLNALDSLSHAASRYEKAYGKAVSDGRAANAKAVNERLIQAERALTSTEGLRSRPWYVHMLYAPGFYTGYGVKTIPGVREAIEQGEWPAADREISRAAAAVEREATLVSGLSTMLGGP
ncbi:MAG: transferrin receptor-like dimerization domain-containing protein, partial [Gemmatimonadales bacterium]